jgi:hypothetical protein
VCMCVCVCVCGLVHFYVSSQLRLVIREQGKAVGGDDEQKKRRWCVCFCVYVCNC